MNEAALNCLSTYIQPTASAAHLLPNLTLESKGPHGQPGHVRTQAAYNGAVCARAMHAALNYRQETESFDRHAHTLAYTYLDGHLRCYSTHTELDGNNGKVRYHLALIRGFDMLDTAEEYKSGIAALRNGRDWAARERSAVLETIERRASSIDPPP